MTACVSSSGATERVWSTYDFIHNKKRNRLAPQRANDLVYVFRNSQLALKQSHPQKFADFVQEYDLEADIQREVRLSDCIMRACR